MDYKSSNSDEYGWEDLIQLDAYNVGQKKRGKQFKKNPLYDTPADVMDLEIMELHNANLGWKPDLCKLSKSHEYRPKSCDKPLTLAQTKVEVNLEARARAFSSMRAWSEQYATA